jgi:glycosyltransferase involved in cell wall biosynthesis
MSGPRPLRLLQVNTLYTRAGGVEAYLAHVLPELRRAGLEVGMMYGVRTEEPLPTGDWQVLHAPALMAGDMPLARRLAALEEQVGRFAPDVIQLNAYDRPEVLAWLCQRWPTVQFLHDTYPLACPGEGKYLKASQDVCTRRMGAFCAVAPWVQRCGSVRPWQHLPRYFSARRYHHAARGLRRLLVASTHMRDELLHNGFPEAQVIRVPLPGLRGEPTSLPPAPTVPERPVVLFVGRLVEQKGPELLLAALAQVGVPCEARFVGDGPLRPLLEEKARRLGVRATFTGWLEGEPLLRAYAEASVVAVPSVWNEPFGLVGLEAMASGKPVVAFARGGIPDWLEHEATGLLVPPKDVPALAAALRRVLEDGALARRLGEAGRRSAHERFAMARHIQRLLDIYRQAALPGDGVAPPGLGTSA